MDLVKKYLGEANEARNPAEKNVNLVKTLGKCKYCGSKEGVGFHDADEFRIYCKKCKKYLDTIS